MDSHYRYRCGEAGSAERMVPAIVLIAIGTIFLLDKLHLFFFRDIIQYWPVLLIAFGIVKLVDSASTGSRVAGGVLASAGGLFLARNLGYLDLRVRDMWPLFLIGIGLWMLFQRTVAEDIPNGKGIYTGNRLKQQAVFSGVKQQIVTPDFQGGKVEVVFGGVEMDFRRAGMVAESAILHIDAVFGGVEVRIPPHWNAELRGNSVFGAFGDETLHPDPAHYPEIKQLILKGGAVFGGVVVKN